MVARVATVAFNGVDVIDVDAQVQVASGMPAFTIVGLGDKAVSESKERVRAAFNSVGLALPPKRITINLAPADLNKEGSHYDLPIALGLLMAMGAMPADSVAQHIVLGELNLDGSIANVAGVLPAAIHANSLGYNIICPAACGSEAAWAGEIDVVAPPDLLALVNHFKGTQVLSPPQPKLAAATESYRDMKDVRGQESAKRALEICAAGGHNLLMIGPPGAGKSMMAARLPGLLPELTPQEALEVSMIHSVAGQLDGGNLIKQRPYRDPHHSASLPALVGGGHKARPGEISLAHNGVLFLDELPEFNRATLESLRQPLETRRVSISRANAHTTYPAKFQLIAAMNPCRCGNLGDAELACNRAPRCGQDYQSKLSGPLLDRIDLHVDMQAVNPRDLANAQPGEASSKISDRVTRARDIQTQRYANENIRVNAEADGDVLEAAAPLNDKSRKLLEDAADKLRLSARSWHRVIKVARTIADLSGGADIESPHIAEALSYRAKVYK